MLLPSRHSKDCKCKIWSHSALGNYGFLFREVSSRRVGEKKLELQCLFGQTHGFRENFQFNQIIIDDVTIFYNKCCPCYSWNNNVSIYMNERTCRSTLVQEICFSRTTYNVQIKAEHLNFQFSHVTKFITKVIHWMSFIVVLYFEKFCANIYFVVNEGSI